MNFNKAMWAYLSYERHSLKADKEMCTPEVKLWEPKTSCAWQGEGGRVVGSD